MNEITLIGIDIGKRVFHLHAQDAKGHEVFRKKLSRAQLLSFFSNFKVVTVVMEACAGAHWLARKLNEMGHQARLISAQYVRPFVKSNKKITSMLRRSVKLPPGRTCASSSRGQKPSNY